jgi:hypothetical protein
MKNLKVSVDFSRFPSSNTLDEFRDFAHEWVAIVQQEKDKERVEVRLSSLATALNASQRVLYTFYLLDVQISNIGLLQVVLNRHVYLYYFLFTQDNVSTISHFDYWGKILFAAFQKSKPIYIEILKAGNTVNPDVVHSKYDEAFAKLDELYLSHRNDFWDSFRKFVINNQEDFFI